MKISGIYKITSPTGKVYIGQSLNILARFYHYEKLDCKGQPILYKSLKKYGYKSHVFEVVFECCIEEINEMERYYQDLYSAVGINGLNCILTKASDRRSEMSIETKNKIRKSKLNMSDEYRKKLSLSNMGKKASAITILKLKESHAYQTNENLRISIIQMDLNGNYINEFISIADAARKVTGNVSANPNIVRSIKKNRTAYGFRWKYSKNEKDNIVLQGDTDIRVNNAKAKGTLIIDQNKHEQTNLFGQAP